MLEQPLNGVSANTDRFAASFTVAIVAMCSVAFGVGRYAYGLFLPAIRHDFGASTVTLGLIASASTLLYLITIAIASTIAIHCRPRTLMLVGGCVTTLSLLIVGLAANLPATAAGIALASVGAGLYSPASWVAVDAWMPSRWRHRAIGAVNAGSTPGLLITGLTAYWFQHSWQYVWLVMAALCGMITLWHAWLVPNDRVIPPTHRPRPPLHARSFLRRECWPLYGALLIYGLVFGVYMTFAVDLILSSGGLVFPADRLFWALLGLAGMPTLFAGLLIARHGVRTLLMWSLPLCGLSYLLLALSAHGGSPPGGSPPGGTLLVLASAVLFGVASIAPGGGFYIWGIRLFPDRPSIGSGCVTLCTAIAMMAGPTLYGLMSRWMSLPSFFALVAILPILALPLLPKNEDLQTR